MFYTSSKLCTMRTIFILILLNGVLSSIPGFAQKLTFSYDASGNQTERRWICINCPNTASLATAAKMAGQSGKINSANGEETPILIAKKLETAPNPLTELLKVRWDTPDKIYLRKIEIYNMGGQRVFSGEYQPAQQETQISFREFPPGTYIFIGYYSDSSKETLKVIKI